MGHIRLGNLPRSRKWRQVIALIGEGASAPDVAALTLSASERGLAGASDDAGLVHSMWLLTQVAQASRKEDFVAGLRELGLAVSDEPTLHDVVAHFSEAVDDEIRQRGGRSDLGEMAQLSAAESLTRMCASHLGTLFGTTTEDVQSALRRFSTTKGFSQLSREFFSRLTFRYLSYFLSREMSNHVGGNRRFFNLGEHTEFLKALEVHSRQASRIVEEFAGGWYSKTAYEEGITKDKTAGFVHVALKKVGAELKKGGEGHEH
ncbi:MAG: hypothetical protein WBF13_10795 [Candidatus Zixiibacteriota bacterium]